MQSIALSQGNFVWLVGSLAQLHRIPFDPALIVQRFPAPHGVGQLLEALRALGFRAGEHTLGREGLKRVPLPCAAFLAPEPAAEAQDTAADPKPAILIKPDRDRTRTGFALSLLCVLGLVISAAPSLAQIKEPEAGVTGGSPYLKIKDVVTGLRYAWCSERGLLYVEMAAPHALTYVEIETRRSEVIRSGKVLGGYFCSHDARYVFYREEKKDLHGRLELLVYDRQVKKTRAIKDYELSLVHQPISPSANIAIAGAQGEALTALIAQQLRSALKDWSVNAHRFPTDRILGFGHGGVWASDGSYYVLPGFGKEGGQDKYVFFTPSGEAFHSVKEETVYGFKGHARAKGLYVCKTGGELVLLSRSTWEIQQVAALRAGGGERFRCLGSNFDVSDDGNIAYENSGIVERSAQGVERQVDALGARPTYSRDGRFLAYSRGADPAGPGQIIVVVSIR